MPLVNCAVCSWCYSRDGRGMLCTRLHLNNHTALNLSRVVLRGCFSPISNPLINNCHKYIPHKWIVVFARFDWLARRWLSKYYPPPSSRRKTKWLPVSNKVTLKQVKLLFGPLVIQLVWYLLKQLFTSVSVKVVDIYLAAWRHPPLFTSTSVNNC